MSTEREATVRRDLVGTVDGEPVHLVLTCFDPAVREVMDIALDRWKEHWEAVRVNFPKGLDYEPDPVYSFAYWLFRYSGLIRPVEEE